jgi:Tol biopolymer transport system component
MVAAILSMVVVGSMLVLLFQSDEPLTGPPGELLLPLNSNGTEARLAVVAADGSTWRYLAPDQSLLGWQSEGVWSPDGNQVAFAVTNGSASDIYVANADGSNLRRLTPPPAWTPTVNQYLTQTAPAWSPDGARIAFSSNLEDGLANFDIYVINADGSNLQRLRDDSLLDWSPRWSPDGAMIAYEVYGEGGADHYGNVYVMNADGTNRRRLVDTIAARDPEWSPDGKWIAYSDGRFGSAVHIVRVDGTERRDLTGVGMIADSPRWSPDGRLLAWSAHEGGGSLDGVFLHDLTTGETQHISNIAGQLEWSPDGVWIAVAYQKVDASGNQTGLSGVYFVRADGQNEEPLIDLPVAGDITMDWRIRRPEIARVIHHDTTEPSHSRAESISARVRP